MHFMKVEKWFSMLLKVEYFHYHQLKVQALILMLQRLPITLAQVEAGNTSENLLIKICQIRYSL